MLKFLLSICLLLFSCEDYGNPVSLNQNLSNYSNVKTIIDLNCLGCHNSEISLGGLNLSTYENIISSGSIIPEDALNSNLVDRITRSAEDALLMPPPDISEGLSQENIDVIIEWINNGALE